MRVWEIYWVLLFLPVVFLFAQSGEIPPFLAPKTSVPDFNATAIINDINVTRAIGLAQTKFRQSAGDPPFSQSVTSASECNCTDVINDINVSRSIELTQLKLYFQQSEGFFEGWMEQMDTYHAEFSQMVHLFGATADHRLAVWTGDEAAKAKSAKPPEDGNASESMSAYFDRLFFDKTYLYSQEASYLILRGGYEVNQKEGNKFLNQVKAAISLPNTQKHLQLFVGDPLSDSEDKQFVNEQGKVDTATGVGARYFIPDFVKDLHTSLSAGFRGILNPFVQLRVEYPMNFFDWLIRPVQYVEYSVDSEFYEETDLYFDRRISKSEMVRLQLQRSTETQKLGMDYGASLTYYNTPRYDTAFRTYVSMSGHTEVEDINTSTLPEGTYEITPGVYVYSIGVGWKQSFLRKWLFYEINPRVDFGMQYNWQPNYVTQFWLDIYFGKD